MTKKKEVSLNHLDPLLDELEIMTKDFDISREDLRQMVMLCFFGLSAVLLIIKFLKNSSNNEREAFFKPFKKLLSPMETI